MRPRIVLLNSDKGMTLIEVLVAFVLFLIVSLALLQVSILSLDQNLQDTIRDEAVNIADMRMNQARGLVYTEQADQLLPDQGSNAQLLKDTGCHSSFKAAYSYGILFTKPVRGIPDYLFCTNREVAVVGNTTNKQVTITVGWVWKGLPYTYSMSSIVRRQ